MSLLTPAATGRPHPRPTVGAFVGVVAALVGLAACGSPTGGTTQASPHVVAPAVAARSAPMSSEDLGADISAHPPGEPPRDSSGSLGKAAEARGLADGHLPDGAEV